MADISISADAGRDSDPYICTPRQRRLQGVAAISFGAIYLASTVIVGPSEIGRIIESSLMAAAALMSSVLSFRNLRRVNEAVRLPWIGFGTGVGLYSIAFALQAGRWAGCEWCIPVAAVVAMAGWVAFGFVLWGAFRLAYRGADIRLWSIEILDGIVVLAAVALWVTYLVELAAIEVPHPVFSVEFVELVGLPLPAAGLVFSMRSISEEIRSYRSLQSLFLVSVIAWILARGWNAESYPYVPWVIYGVARASVITCAISISAYGIKPGVSLEIFNVQGPEDRPVGHVSVVVGILAGHVVFARIFADPGGIVHEISLPVLAVIALLLVVRLVLTSEYHKHLEDTVTDSSIRQRDLVEESHQGIVEIDTYGKVRFSNEAAAEIIGVDRASLMGRDIEELLEPVKLDSIESDSGSTNYDAAQVGLAAQLRAGSRVVARVAETDKDPRYVELAPSPAAKGVPSKTLLRDVTVEVERRLRVQSLIKDLRAKDTERSGLMRDMLETAESERYSIASQLHDGPVQHLTLLALKTDLLRRRVAGGQFDEVVSACAEIADEVRSEAEYLTDLGDALSPSVRPDTDLVRSIEAMTQRLFQSKSVTERVTWKVSASGDMNCDSAAKIALYRSLQAIALDARVSGARRAEIKLDSDDSSVTATFVTDAPLDNARARGVARAKVWVVQMGGSFFERRRGAFYEAELHLPSSSGESS